MSNSLVDLVERAAEARRETKIPRDYIVEALEVIQSGKVDVVRYPTGFPSLKAVYDVASTLYNEQRGKPANK